MSLNELRRRLRAVEARLAAHASAGPLPGLTDPDPGATERWEAGQVWAHLAEFPAYWLAQARLVVAARAEGAPEPIAFGRTKTDPQRLAAIERDRRTDPGRLLVLVREGVSATAAALDAWDAEALAARGRHLTLGEMSVERLLEHFIVAHLEEHADQLDGLADAT